MTTAAHAHCTNIRKVVSRGQVQIILEIPSEHYASAVATFDEKKVLVTLAPPNMEHMPFGVLNADAETEAPQQQEAEPETNGQKWRGLIKNGLFNAPAFLRALGTDADYQAWCRRQPSAISKRFIEYSEKDGEGRCVYSHDRRAGQDGTGYKNPGAYSGVPMTDPEHSQCQHQSGLLALMRASRPGIAPENDNVQGAKDWMERLVAHHRQQWGKSRLCEIFGVDSRADISMAELWSWADGLDDREAVRVLESMGVNNAHQPAPGVAH